MNHRIPLFLFAGIVGLSCLQCGSAKAAGTYNLQYPAGYGCRCTPNVMGYGVFPTKWQPFPGEQRLDQTYPKTIGAEKLPPVKGRETLPLPRVKLKDITPPAEQPGMGGPQGLPNNPLGNPGMPEFNPGGGLPGSDTLPGGGFGPETQPPQGLPPDFSYPGLNDKPKDQPPELPKDSPEPLKKTDDSSKNFKATPNREIGGMKAKSNSSNRGSVNQPAMKRPGEKDVMKSYQPKRLPDTKSAPALETDSLSQIRPQANWESTLQAEMLADTSRSGSIYPSTGYAQQADYQPSNEIAGRQTSIDVIRQPLSLDSQSPAIDRQENKVVRPTNGRPEIPNKTSELPDIINLNTNKSASLIPSEIKQLSAPPTALQGFCPVALAREGRWVQGDPRWTVIHQGFTYRLSGNDQRAQFLAHPELFAPANGGNDPVISSAQKRNQAGEVSYCAEFKGRIYMFVNAETQAEFQKNPERYVNAK
jgi:YHS domain-containing protein